MRTAIAAAALLAVSAGTPRAQDVETGKASFRKCVLCHSIGENAKNKVGSELNGLDGRSAGAVPGFHLTPAAGARVVRNACLTQKLARDATSNQGKADFFATDKPRTSPWSTRR